MIPVYIRFDPSERSEETVADCAGRLSQDRVYRVFALVGRASEDDRATFLIKANDGRFMEADVSLFREARAKDYRKQKPLREMNLAPAISTVEMNSCPYCGSLNCPNAKDGPHVVISSRKP